MSQFSSNLSTLTVYNNNNFVCTYTLYKAKPPRLYSNHPGLRSIPNTYMVHLCFWLCFYALSFQFLWLHYFVDVKSYPSKHDNTHQLKYTSVHYLHKLTSIPWTSRWIILAFPGVKVWICLPCSSQYCQLKPTLHAIIYFYLDMSF